MGLGLSAFMSSVGPEICGMWIGFGLRLPGSAGLTCGGGVMLSIVRGMRSLSFATHAAQSRAARQQRAQATAQQRQAGHRAESVLAQMRNTAVAPRWR